MLAKSLLRPHYTSTLVNSHMKRLYQLMNKIHQNQMDLSSKTNQSTTIVNNTTNSSNDFTEKFVIESSSTN